MFRTAEGSKLLGLTMNADVAFEIDEYTEEDARSVVVRGRARQLEGDEADETDQLPLRPWVEGAKFNVDRRRGRRDRRPALRADPAVAAHAAAPEI